MRVRKMKTEIRRKLLLLSLSGFSLLSCGGDGISVVEGGISGTGITLGRITQFGSIYVNNVRFSVDGASFTRDGEPSIGQSEFSLGEYIMIKGIFDANGSGGTAIEVSFNDILEGAVTQVTSDNVMIEVLGQSVMINNLTTLLGFSTLHELAAGNIVEVSGFKNAEGLINATSIKLKQASFVAGISENELKGIISTVNVAGETLIIGNIVIDYSAATLEGFMEGGPQVGQKVEVKSDSEVIGNTLIATKIELEKGSQNVVTNTNLEVEGIVTRFISLLDFDVNGIMVTTHSQTEYKNGESVDIGLNSIIEVKGKVNMLGVLVAEQIEFESNGSEESGSGSEDEDSSQNDSDDDNDGGKESEEPSGDDNGNSEDDENEDSSEGGDESNDIDDDNENEESFVEEGMAKKKMRVLLRVNLVKKRLIQIVKAKNLLKMEAKRKNLKKRAKRKMKSPQKVVMMKS